MENYIIISLFALVNGYPEAGYNYNHPSYIINNHHNHGIDHSNGQLISGISGTGNNVGFTGSNNNNIGYSSSTSNGNYASSGNGLIGGNNYNINGDGINKIGIVNSNVIDTGFNNNNNNIGGSTISSTLVQKHIYVHIPPPDLLDNNNQIQRQISTIPSQKHYKIIFIKAPTTSFNQQQQISLAGQNQEKTIVYVLVKKSDDINDLKISQIPPTPPSKPEVYFIKYKAQKELNIGGLSGNTVTSNEIKTTTGQSISESGGIGGINNSNEFSTGGGSFTSSGIASSSIAGGGPITQYGPPGKSGPY